MRTRSRLLLAALTTALALGALVGAASARRYGLSETEFRARWKSLVFGPGSTLEVRCPVTLEGSLHSRTFSKVVEALIGYVTTALLNSAACTGGHARIQAETLPWHIRYESFEGRLPNITAINLRIVGAGFAVESNGVLCLYKSSAAEPIKATIQMPDGHTAESIRLNEAAGIPKASGSVFCPAPGHLGGTTESLTIQSSGVTKIIVSLIE